MVEGFTLFALLPIVKMRPYYHEKTQDKRDKRSKDPRYENERVPDKLNRIYLSNIEGYFVEKWYTI